MRIGLLADIHEAADRLRSALAILAGERVDAVVQIGDAVDLPRPATTATVRLLAAAGVPGVWGNHDYGFCRDVPEFLTERTPPDVLAYLAGMQPRLEIGGCHFSHADPYLDPHDPVAFYLAAGEPDTLDRAAPSFAAVPHRVCFMGHYHRWLVTSDAGPVAWDGRTPIILDPARRFVVVVGPLVSGHFGVYDTGTCVLTPYRC